MYKRWIGILAVLVLLLTVPAGCGKTPSTPEDVKADDVITESTALTADELTAVQTYLNVKENNSHLFVTYTEIAVVGGTKTEDGVYTVRYRPASADGGLYIVTLNQTEDGYRVISNQQMQ